MAASWPFYLPEWHDGQQWTYELVRGGKDPFTGQLIYRATQLDDDSWRIEGRSDYPGERSLHEWVEIGGEPVRALRAFFERRNTAGLYRYEASQAADGRLTLTVTTDRSQRQEEHDARRGPVFIGNQLDFLLHGLDLEADGPWMVRLRVEGGRVYAGEIKLVGREVPLTMDGETVPATLVTVRGGSNPLIRAIAPPLRYWFHPKDQTMLLRIEQGDTTLNLIDAS